MATYLTLVYLPLAGHLRGDIVAARGGCGGFRSMAAATSAPGEWLGSSRVDAEGTSVDAPSGTAFRTPACVRLASDWR